MNKTKLIRVIIGTIVIVSASAYLLYEAASSSWAYYFTVSEFIKSDLYKNISIENNAKKNALVRIAGTVKENSISRNIEKMQLNFELNGREISLPVEYSGTIPVNFKAGKEVVVEGKFDSDKIFKATKLITRCESKYKTKLQKKNGI